jgi:hypothetical protein
MRIYWELIIDSDVLRSTLDEGFDSENTFFIIFSLVEHLWNEVSSFSQSCSDSEEIVVSN